LQIITGFEVAAATIPKIYARRGDVGMSFVCMRGMFFAIGRPEIDGGQPGKKPLILGHGLCRILNATAVNVDMEQNGGWLVRWL
jgi:hypothetical protein